jgi:hypothetical protein
VCQSQRAHGEIDAVVIHRQRGQVAGTNLRLRKLGVQRCEHPRRGVDCDDRVPAVQQSRGVTARAARRVKRTAGLNTIQDRPNRALLSRDDRIRCIVVDRGLGVIARSTIDLFDIANGAQLGRVPALDEPCNVCDARLDLLAIPVGPQSQQGKPFNTQRHMHTASAHGGNVSSTHLRSDAGSTSAARRQTVLARLSLRPPHDRVTPGRRESRPALRPTPPRAQCHCCFDANGAVERCFG